MKKLIAVVFTVSMMISVASHAETPATNASQQQAHASQAPATQKFIPMAPVFGDASNAFKPTVNNCQPGQGAQSFNSALGNVSGY